MYCRTRRWRGRLGCLAAVAATTLAAALFAGPDAVAQIVPHDLFGISGGWSGPASPDNPTLAAMRAGGATMLRGDATWASAEPTAPVAGQPPTFSWSAEDATATALARLGLRWYPVLDGPPSWAVTSPPSDSVWGVPSDPSRFAGYARAFAARYGSGGSFWSANQQLPYLPVAASGDRGVGRPA